MFKKEVKILYIDRECQFEKHGNWMDLKSKEPITAYEGEFQEIPLGIAMTLPKWYKAEIKPRSSSYKNFGFIQANSVGEIENDFCKEWRLPAIFLKFGVIRKYDRICQFQIKLREDAPWYAKIADLFISGFKYTEVDVLTTSRGGLGHTGQ